MLFFFLPFFLFLLINFTTEMNLKLTVSSPSDILNKMQYISHVCCFRVGIGLCAVLFSFSFSSSSSFLLTYPLLFALNCFRYKLLTLCFFCGCFFFVTIFIIIINFFSPLLHFNKQFITETKKIMNAIGLVLICCATFHF